MTTAKFILTLIFCIILLQTSSAQDKQDNAWTLQECIEYALKNNIQVKKSELNVMYSDATHKQSKYDLLPDLNGQISYRYNLGRSINPFNNQYEQDPVQSNNVSLNSSVILFGGFQKLNTIKKNKIDFQTSLYDLEDQKNQVILDLISFYIQIVFNKELLEAAQFRLETSTLQVERTEKLVNAGSLPQSNLFDIKAQKATDELDVITAQNQLNLSLLNLVQLLQIPADQEFNIVTPEIEDPDGSEYPDQLSDIYSTALATQPVIKSIDSKVESSEYNLEIARGAFYPTLSLFAGLGTAYSSVAPDQIPRSGSPTQTVPVTVGYLNGDLNQPVLTDQTIPTEFTENTYWNQLDFNLNRYFGVSLNVPIFSNWRTRYNIQTAKISRESFKYDAINTRNLLRQSVEKAFWDAKGAMSSYIANKNQVQAMQEAFRSTEQRFNLGAINAVEYNIAKTNFNRAESDLIRAKYDYIFRTKILDFYQGKPLEF